MSAFCKLIGDYGNGVSIAPSGGWVPTNDEFGYASELGREGLGTINVQGAGNNNIDSQFSGLNASRFTITVAGIQEDGFPANFANYGACILVTAPATGIYSTDLSGADGFNAGGDRGVKDLLVAIGALTPGTNGTARGSSRR